MPSLNNKNPSSTRSGCVLRAVCCSLLFLGAAAYAQTVLPVINLQLGGAKGAGVGSVGAPGLGIAAPATLGTPMSGDANSAMPIPGVRNAQTPGDLAGGKIDAKTLAKGADAKAAGAEGKAASADGKADAKAAKADKTAPDGSEPPAAEQVKDATADEVEFQRFVYGATGQSLRLFGYELFSKPSGFAAVQAAPVPAGYILGPGDELVVQVNGLVEVNERLVIDRDGRVLVPKVGPLNLAGVALSDAERVFSAHIGKVYRNFTVSVTMGRLRSIEVFVVGQARKPGKHLVSSLSSLINALFETGGPSANGSLRAIELRRGGKKIAVVDLYAFLALGDNSADVQLLAGDIIFIPPAYARAALLGTINAPAIYELREGETIQQILAMSGGLPTLAAPQKAQLERVDANRDIARYVEDFALDAKGLGLMLKAGDILTVFQISPQIANVVTLQGNVAAPLRYTYHPGMRVADLLSDKRLLIPGSYWLQINRGATTGNYSRPEVNLDYATVQRLDPVALRTRVLSFNLAKAVALDPLENMELLSGDIVTVYRPGEVGPETENSVLVTGEIVGGSKRFVWRPGFTIRDIIPSSQWLVDYYSYWQRPSGRSLRNDINWDYAQVIRQVPSSLSTRALTFNLGQAVRNASVADNIKLEPGDQIALFTTAQLAVPLEKRTQMVTLAGEVNIPGEYQLSPGETLPELIKRAGGLSHNAFSYGIVFTRESTRAQQQENLDKSIRRMEADISSQTATLAQNVAEASDKGTTQQAQIELQKALLTRLHQLKASGRISLDLDASNPVIPDIVLEDGDLVTVPHRPSSVGVFGEVYVESAFIHKPGNTVSDYLDKAGLTRDADADGLMLIRADGSVESASRRFLLRSYGLMGKEMNPGDTIFVPGVVDRRSAYTQFMQGAKDWTTILYQFGLGARRRRRRDQPAGPAAGRGRQPAPAGVGPDRRGPAGPGHQLCHPAHLHRHHPVHAAAAAKQWRSRAREEPGRPGRLGGGGHRHQEPERPVCRLPEEHYGGRRDARPLEADGALRLRVQGRRPQRAGGQHPHHQRQGRPDRGGSGRPRSGFFRPDRQRLCGRAGQPAQAHDHHRSAATPRLFRAATGPDQREAQPGRAGAQGQRREQLGAQVERRRRAGRGPVAGPDHRARGQAGQHARLPGRQCARVQAGAKRAECVSGATAQGRQPGECLPRCRRRLPEPFSRREVPGVAVRAVCPSI
jgi:protein involved in polysaccharide export with SLBB domain